MAEITYWEKNFSGDIYNTNPTAKVGINNGDPLNTLDVIGSIGLTTILEFKKPGHDIIQMSTASELGYDFRIRNITDNRSVIHVDNLGRVAINTNSNTARLTVMENRAGNAWPAASFTNTSEVGFGIEVTGGNAGNNILTLKNYNDSLRATLDGYGNWWTKGSMTSDNATSIGGTDHYVMANERHRFSQLLIDEETGINNEGSNFIWRRYADDGTMLANILKVIRNSGLIKFYGDAVWTGDLTVTGKITAGEDTRTLEDIKDPSGKNDKLLIVENGYYVFKSPNEVFFPDLSSYYTKVEIDLLFDDVDNNIDNNIRNYLIANPISLDDVAKVNNTTEEVLITTASIVTPLVNVGTSQIKEINGTLNVTNDTHIQGLLTFEDINLKLYQLDDVANSVENAPSTYILQKLSGEWVAAPLPTTDLSNYYNKQGSDQRYVQIPGDTMTGELIIDAPSNNLRLNSLYNSTALSIYPTGSNDSIYNISTSDDSITTSYNSDNYYLNHAVLGTIMHVDSTGSVYFGDPTDKLGKVIIQNETPSIIFHSVTSDNAFRIYTTNSKTYFHVGSGLGFSGLSTPVVMNSTNIELNYNSDKRLETTSTGVKIYYDLDTTSAHVDGIHLYKASDGSFIIDGDVNITGKYLEDWAGVGTGNPPGAWTLNELEDVNLGSSTVSGVAFPFILGRNTSSGAFAVPLTKTDVITMLGVVELPDFNNHINDLDIHITTTERSLWNEAYNTISETRDWDLSYSSNGYKEIGLSHIDEDGSAIGNNKSYMKYLFYWDTGAGPKWSIKTRFSDDADHLGQKPADEHRYTRALGYSGANCDTIFERSLYDLGTTTKSAVNVPEDGSWQLETVDASYLFNQNESDTIKHKHQWATRWVDRENNFDLWARTHDGSTPEWLPWVQFWHSGNMPGTADALEFYPTLPQSAYDALESEANWYITGTPQYEVYIGEVSGTGWSLNIGQRVVTNYYIYESTPLGVKRSPRGASYLYQMLDVDFLPYAEETSLDQGDILVYQGDETWKPSPQYIVQELTISGTESTVTVEPTIDRLELILEVSASAFDVIIDHNREKPLVIDLNNLSVNDVSIKYSDDINPDELLLVMLPDAVIEVHPGIWELN